MSNITHRNENGQIIKGSFLTFRNNTPQDKLTIRSEPATNAIDFDAVDHVEINDVRVQKITSEYSDEDMITFSNSGPGLDRISFNNIPIDNAVLHSPSLVGITISNPTLDYNAETRAKRVLITDLDGDVSFTVGGGNTSTYEMLVDDVVQKDLTQTLTYKTLDTGTTLTSNVSFPSNVVQLTGAQILEDKSISLTDNNTISGLTANNIAVADVSGNLTGSGKALSDLVDLTTSGQNITGQKTLTSPILTNPLIGTIYATNGNPILTLGTTTTIPPIASSFTTDLTTDGKIIAKGGGLLTNSTIKHYLTSSPFTETTCLTLDGSGNVDVAGALKLSGHTIPVSYTHLTLPTKRIV